jgi:hypothetical protein
MPHITIQSWERPPLPNFGAEVRFSKRLLVKVVQKVGLATVTGAAIWEMKLPFQQTE